MEERASGRLGGGADVPVRTYLLGLIKDDYNCCHGLHASRVGGNRTLPSTPNRLHRLGTTEPGEAILVAFAFSGFPPVASIKCKVLTENDCMANQECVWKPARTAKTGNAIPARCVSVCTGLIKEACSANAACQWKDEFTRKDGKVVKAHCVNLGKKKTPGENPGDKALITAPERQVGDSSVSAPTKN